MALGFMRRHRRWLYVFLWVVIAAFIILYVPAFRTAQSGSPAETVARVGDETITAGEFQRAYLEQRRRLEQVYQGRLDAATLRSLRVEERVFEGLVAERLVELEAQRLGLQVGDADLRRAIETDPRFQRDGRFVGGAELKQLLKLRGLEPAEFEAGLRRELLRRRLELVVTGGVTVSEAEAEAEYRRRNEQVRLEYAQVEAAPLAAAAAVGDEEVKARFEQQKERYRVPEKRVVSFVLVDPEALRAKVTVTDAEIEGYYREHQDEFKEGEQVCASHVLVKVKGNAEAKEGHAPDEARRIATAVLEKARGGADFAELAKASSEDQGSASRGGDLGCFGRGRMVPEFENAAFSLDPGQISDLVQTSFGFHVIRVQSRREESVPALSAVKERIRQLMVSQRVQSQGQEQVEAITAALAGGQALEKVAAERGLAVQKSPAFERGRAPAPISSPQLAARAFELKPGETDREGAAVGRGYAFFALTEVQPSRLPELKEAQERVKADLVQEKAFAAAREKAAELRSRAEKDGLEKAATAAGLTRKETPQLVGRGQPLGDLGSSAELDQAAFALAPQALSEPVRTPAGYAVLRLLEKKPVDEGALARERASLVASLRDERRNRLFQSYLEQLRQRYAVERHADVFRRVVG